MRQVDHQADHVLRAYRYQLLHALQEWIDLRPDQELLLEIDEDHATVSDLRSESTQVKFSAAAAGARSISLRSPGVVQAIQRFWYQSNGGTDLRPHLRFLTNSSAAREQGAVLPGDQAGLTYWKEAASGEDTSPLRDLLAVIFANSPLGIWLQSNPSDAEIRTQLLQRIEFVLGAPDDLTLQTHIRERLGMLYLGKGHYETAADTALPMLLDRVFVAASSPDVKARRLTVGDLHRALEEALPRLGALLQAQMAQARPETGIGVTSLRLRAGLSPRSATVAALVVRAGPQPIIWLYGANGVGKSTLAKLMAISQGGSWLVCDFRPFLADSDSRGAVAVWRELMAALSIGSIQDGIILDDISARSIDLLKSRVSGLAAASKIRGGKIIITSNHTPSPALLAEIGATPQAALDAPYFSVAEVRELVAQPAAPEPALREGWANLIYVSTSGGHPLLVAAKIANLRARGWPDQALLEDLGPQANEGVKGTRSEARRRLLAELPPNTSARAVLERVSTVFQSFEDGLVHTLCRDAPVVEHPSDALTLLKGSWLEPVHDGGWRLSPLLSDLGADVPEDRARRWRQIAAVYWLSKKTLNARTLPLCFWNAFLGRHPQVLLKVSEVVMQLSPGKVQSAAAMLSPLAAFRTDRPIMPEEPMMSCNLRLLQVVVADAIEDESAAASAAECLLREIDAVSVAEYRELETSLSAKVVLGLDRVWIPAATQIAYLRRLKATVTRVMGGSFPALKPSIQSLVWGLPTGADIPGLLLASVFMRVRASAHLCEMIGALAEMETGERDTLITSVQAVLHDLGTFIHNAWANEQVSGKDMRPTLAYYDRMRARVTDWGMPALEGELAVAQSVILDECLEDRTEALAVIDAAIEKFGKRPTLIRQKSKVLRHQGSNEAAASLLIEIEDDIADLPPFDQGLALRDGGVAAANSNRHDDALRLLRKANAVFAAQGSHEALRVGLTVDEAMVLWQKGQRQAGLRRTGDALETVERLDPAVSRQNLRAHGSARALVGLFMHDVDPFPTGPRPSVTPGMGSVLESSEKPERVDLKPLPDNWRILEMVEVEAGVDGDIARRSAARQGASRIVAIEANLAKAHFARALEMGDIDTAVRSIAPAVSLLKHVKAALESKQEGDRALIRADVGILGPLSIAELVSCEWQDAIQGALVDIMLTLALSGRWTPDAPRQLREAAVAHWKSDDLLSPLLDVVRGSVAVDGSMAMPMLVASSLITIGQDAELSPRDRVHRDLYWLYQAANSMGRRVP